MKHTVHVYFELPSLDCISLFCTFSFVFTFILLNQLILLKQLRTFSLEYMEAGSDLKM